MLKFMDSHGLVLQDLADGGLDLRVDLFEELVIVLFLLIIFLNMRQPHNELHVLILPLHMILYQCASISASVVEVYLGLHF